MTHRTTNAARSSDNFTKGPLEDSFLDDDFDLDDESSRVSLKIVQCSSSNEVSDKAPGHMFNADTVPAGTFMAKAFTKLDPFNSTSPSRIVKGSNKKITLASPKDRIESAAEAASYVKLVISVISQSLNDATPSSIIMDLTGQSATASPDIGAVFDAVDFFRSERLEAWTEVIGAEAYGIKREFERQFKAWIEARGMEMANQIIQGVMDAMDSKPSGLTPDAAGTFMRNEALVEFWCKIANVSPQVLHNFYKKHSSTTLSKRSNGEHKVTEHKFIGGIGRAATKSIHRVKLGKKFNGKTIKPTGIPGVTGMLF